MNGNKPKPRKEKPGEDTRAKMVAALSLGGGPRLIFVFFFLYLFYSTNIHGATAGARPVQGTGSPAVNCTS